MAAGSNTFRTAILNAEPVVRSVGNIVARCGFAIVVGSIGIFKFYPYEAHNIQPLVSHRPFMGWLYSLFRVGTFLAETRRYSGSHCAPVGDKTVASDGVAVGKCVGDSAFREHIVLGDHDTGCGRGVGRRLSAVIHDQPVPHQRYCLNWGIDIERSLTP
jgi:hypothetical protein